MKFSTTIAVALFGIGTQAFTLPSLAERQSSPVTVLQADIAALQVAVTGDLGDITTAVQNSGGDSSAQVQLAASVNADLTDIVNQILRATKKVIFATKSAAVTLDPVDLQSLVAVLQSFQTLVANIQDDLQNAQSQLPSETQAAISGEIVAVQNALAGLQAPLTTYAGQVQKATTSTGTTDPGIGGLVSSILSAVSGLLGNLGLGSVTAQVGTTVGGTATSNPLNGILGGLNVRQAPSVPNLPVSLPGGLNPTDLISSILAEVEALLTKFLGGTGLPVRELSDAVQE